MKKLLILCSSIYVKNQFFYKHSINLQYGKDRVEQYIEGFKSLSENKVYNFFDTSLLIDNTTNKIVDSKILKNIPVNIIKKLKKNNNKGLYNKGAGVIESLLTVKEIISKHDRVFYFEPKLNLQDISIVEKYFENKKNIFYTFENDNQVKSGYFWSSSVDLVEFIGSINLDKMIKGKINLENYCMIFILKEIQRLLKVIAHCGKILEIMNGSNIRSSYKENNFEIEFERICNKFKPVSILEIGLLDGYSLELFEKYTLKSTQIKGVDIFEDYKFKNADKDYLIQKFINYKNVTIENGDFFTYYKKKEEYDLIHIDISNDGDIYKFAIENYLNLAKKALLLEGGSEDRDKVEWMIKYNKTPINKYLKKISSNIDFKIIEKFPSMTIISTQ